MPEAPTLDDEETAEFAAGVAAFNGRDFYAAHDHFEALWGEDFWKGLVQAAVALHHYSVGNRPGIVGLPENVPRLLDPYRPAYHGIDVDRFLDEFGRFFEAVAADEAPEPSSAPRLHPASATSAQRSWTAADSARGDDP